MYHVSSIAELVLDLSYQICCNMFKAIKKILDRFLEKRRIKKRLKELRKRDPFIYK